MAQITYSNATKYRNYGSEDHQETDRREETIRDKILKLLSKKQLQTTTTFARARSQKVFLKSSTEESMTNKTEGLLSLPHFKDVQSLFETKAFLAASNLTEQEINILVNQRQTNESSQSTRRKLESIELKIQKRLDQLENNEPEIFSEALPLSKEELEVELSKSALSSDADKLAAVLVRPKNSKDSNFPPNHPIHSLPQLEKDLFAPIIKPIEVTVESPKKCCITQATSSQKTKSSSKRKTLWDVETLEVIPKRTCEMPLVQPDVLLSQPLAVTKPVHSIKTDYSKPFVWQMSASQLTDLDEIRSNRLPVDAIRSLPKFHKYSPGVPSETLYIKNLPAACSPTKLVSIFANFDQSSRFLTRYRLLKGKMKGQAFATFKTVDQAQEALNSCNGYVIHGKPMIIAFGRQQT